MSITPAAALNIAGLDHLDALAGAASRGPWECREADGLASVLTQDGWLDSCTAEQDVANARFISAANPEAIRALVAIARRAAQLEADLAARDSVQDLPRKPKTDAEHRADFELALKGNNLRRFDTTVSHACYVDRLIENMWKGWLRKVGFDARPRANAKKGA
jgi:prophage DNA circulation protein